MTGECTCAWFWGGRDCSAVSAIGASVLSLLLLALAVGAVAAGMRRWSVHKQEDAVRGTLNELRCATLYTYELLFMYM
jgi:predicted lipoprotein with Yx(FWY)xxD motif